VNGKPVTAQVTPRTHLADFLRSHLSLTGTHLGCEQGVCGACTVIIDGKAARSCITFAVACEGTAVTTIEGLDEDPVAHDLREAFSVHHGLQCGFCTPGMLVAARDLILRQGECDEAQIREEMSGNLCRCTGYVGIVAAIKAASSGRQPQAFAGVAPVADTAPVAKLVPKSEPLEALAPAAPLLASKAGWTEVAHRLEVDGSPESVWLLLQDIPRVAHCLPGAEVESIENGAIRGRMLVKFGPIKASFAGTGTVSMDQARRSGVLTGGGRDTGSGTQTQGELKYRVSPDEHGGSVIDIDMQYRLSGPLAQFSRGALVRDLVAQLADQFGQNLSLLLVGGEKAANKNNELSIGAAVFGTLKRRLLSLFRKS
jgi:carbon-monoxide dehydrogenase small subunit